MIGHRIAFLIVFLAVATFACGYKTDIPLEFPTPPSEPDASPLAKLEYKHDAELEKRIAVIVETARGKVGVAAVVIETGEAAFLNAAERFPMQSVYKLPIAMAVMDKVRLGDLELDEIVAVPPEDFVRAGMRSPLRDANPMGGVFTIRELIRLSIVESDGTASDVLLRVVGGAHEVQHFLSQIGITNLRVVNSEKEIGRDWNTQYQNWVTPTAAAELLRWLGTAAKIEGVSGVTQEPADGEDSRGLDVLVTFLIDSVPGKMRLKNQIPKGARVAHKTGTSGTENGFTAATNDIGIIDLPSGRHLAIAVFVSDSPADEKTREAIIANIAKTVWDRWGSAAVSTTP
ncbi:MAG: class A beta-lactamase [Pyrinomonadaceae bacterium]